MVFCQANLGLAYEYRAPHYEIEQPKVVALNSGRSFFIAGGLVCAPQ